LPSGCQTPRHALQSPLAQHDPWLSAAGWQVTKYDASGATFTSGNDTVDLVQNKAAKWSVGGVTGCK
jgi:hypothetical protein